MKSLDDVIKGTTVCMNYECIECPYVESSRCTNCLKEDTKAYLAELSEYKNHESKAAECKAEYDAKKEMVNHPDHYNREGAMECIDEMILVFGESMVATFCLLNVWKYRSRAADKNGKEDIKKSDWYMNKYKELKDRENDHIRSMMNTGVSKVIKDGDW